MNMGIKQLKNLKFTLKDIKDLSRRVNSIPPCKTMCNRKKYKRTNKIDMEE